MENNLEKTNKTARFVFKKNHQKVHFIEFFIFTFKIVLNRFAENRNQIYNVCFSDNCNFYFNGKVVVIGLAKTTIILGNCSPSIQKVWRVGLLDNHKVVRFFEALTGEGYLFLLEEQINPNVKWNFEKWGSRHLIWRSVARRILQ